MKEFKDSKAKRVIYIYEKLTNGEILNKREAALRFNVTDKTIQRDLEDINLYFTEKYMGINQPEIKYSSKLKGYYLDNFKCSRLNKKEVLALSKILLESRAFNSEELKQLIRLLKLQISEKDRKHIENIIKNEEFYYMPIKHNKNLLDILYSLSEIIRLKEKIQVKYIKMNGKQINRVINPVSIIFSEYYFYLIAFHDGSDFSEPLVYRVDRIIEYIKKGKFDIPESKRFQDGEFRKRVQFMYPGKLKKIKFEFWGDSIEAVLDRLPTARIVDKINNKYVIEAEVYGKGIKMWFLTQGSKIKLISPIDLKEEMIKEIRMMREIYDNF